MLGKIGHTWRTSSILLMLPEQKLSPLTGRTMQSQWGNAMCMMPCGVSPPVEISCYRLPLSAASRVWAVNLLVFCLLCLSESRVFFLFCSESAALWPWSRLLSVPTQMVKEAAAPSWSSAGRATEIKGVLVNAIWYRVWKRGFPHQKEWYHRDEMCLSNEVKNRIWSKWTTGSL